MRDFQSTGYGSPTGPWGYSGEKIPPEGGAAEENGLLTAGSALPFVLGFPIGHGLPLHVLGAVWPAAGEGPNMVNDVAGTTAPTVPGGRAGVRTLEFVLGACAAGLCARKG